MFRLLLIIGFTSLHLVANAQAFYIDGAIAHVDSSVELHLDSMSIVAQINGAGGTIDNDGDIYLDLDFTNNSSGTDVFTNSNGLGTLHFTGDQTQTVGGSEGFVFENVVFENSAPGTSQIVLQQNLVIDDSAVFTDGLVLVSGGNELRFSDDAFSNGGNPDSYAIGSITKLGDDDFVFPSGDSISWARIRVDNSSGTPASAINVSYNRTGFNPTAIIDSLNNVSELEHWEVNQLTGSDSFFVTLFYEDSDFSAINDPIPDLRVAMHDSIGWVDKGRGAFSDTSGNTGYVTSSVKLAQSTSDPMRVSFASISPLVNILPLNRFDLYAERNLTSVDLALELEYQGKITHIDLMRSVNGYDFVVLESLANTYFAFGGLRRLRYTDLHPTESNYYKARMTTPEGKVYFSDVVHVGILARSEVISVYPNPSSKVLYLTFPLDSGTDGEHPQLLLYNMLGRQMSAKFSLQPSNGRAVLDLADIPPANYILRFQYRGESFTYPVQVR